MIDKLIEKIDELKNPSVVGLDTLPDYLPDNMKKNINTLEDAAKAVLEFNLNLIEKIWKLVPAVKVQVACYEMFGLAGMDTFQKTLKAAKDKGLVVISDIKRGDIGSTAACYSKAFLGKVALGGKETTAFDSDFVTVNGYFGIDGIKPFLDDAKKYDKGMFVLCKTSNPSGGEIQDRIVEGAPLYAHVGELIEKWGSDNIGRFGYSRVGAVVGATYPKESEMLRKLMPHTMFLVPGYGAQGGSASDLRYCFDSKGRGAVVNSSRGILCAYKSEKYAGKDYAAAAESAVIDMREDIVKVL